LNGIQTIGQRNVGSVLLLHCWSSQLCPRIGNDKGYSGDNRA
jgi:hypothetical protein